MNGCPVLGRVSRHEFDTVTDAEALASGKLHPQRDLACTVAVRAMLTTRTSASRSSTRAGSTRRLGRPPLFIPEERLAAARRCCPTSPLPRAGRWGGGRVSSPPGCRDQPRKAYRRVAGTVQICGFGERLRCPRFRSCLICKTGEGSRCVMFAVARYRTAGASVGQVFLRRPGPRAPHP